jgi:flagella synthesis protein FlgN
MMSAVSRIAELLAVELSHLQSFATVLAEEQAELQAGKAESLNRITAEKSQLAAVLASALAERESALASAGHGPGRAGMEAWLAQAPDSIRRQASANWSSLLALAERCRADHEINGKLIAIQLAHTQQALAALMNAGGQTLTYGPDGQQRIGGGRSLGSA